MSPEPLTPRARKQAMRLLSAIYDKTGGRSRGVRDVAELETGLTADDSRTAWRDLLGLGLIERFSQDYAARLSPAGVEFIDSGQLVAALRASPREITRRVFIVRGPDTGVREDVARFVGEIGFQAILPHDAGRTMMEEVERHGDIDFVVVLLTPDDLGGASEFRPSLNVLMELGFFLGRFGRAKVCAFAVGCAVDLPSDFAGVTLHAFDAAGEWKSALGRGLRAAGYETEG